MRRARKAVLVLVGLILLFWAKPSCAQGPTGDLTSSGLTLAFGALAGADIGLTAHCLGVGTCREANPLLRPLAGYPGWLGASKAVLNTGAVLGVYKWTKPHSRKRYIILGTLIAAQGAVVALNARQLRGAQ